MKNICVIVLQLRLNSAQLGVRPDTTVSFMSNTTATPDSTEPNYRYDFTADMMGRLEQMLVQLMSMWKQGRTEPGSRPETPEQAPPNPAEFLLSQLEEIQSASQAYTFSVNAQLSNLAEREQIISGTVADLERRVADLERTVEKRGADLFSEAFVS